MSPGILSQCMLQLMCSLRARNVVAAILRRLTHRTSNVQLYTLTLAESLTKNCGVELHREIASRAFTQGLEKLITDRVRTDNARDSTKRADLALSEHSR